MCEGGKVCLEIFWVFRVVLVLVLTTHLVWVGGREGAGEAGGLSRQI